MSFEVLLGGVGDAFSLEHHGTHLLVRKDEFVLAVDCPDTFRRALKEHRFPEQKEAMDVGDIDALYLTHLHGDHVNGLEMTLAYRAMVLKKDPLPIYGIPEVLVPLWEERLRVSLGQMFDGKEIHPIEAARYFRLFPVSERSSNQIGPFGVEVRRTRHHIPTTAMRISDGEARLGYSCDTAFDPELVKWLEEESEWIVHECTYGEAHTQLPQLQGLDAAIRERMILVHYSDQMIGLDTGDLRMGRQGEVLEVGE